MDIQMPIMDGYEATQKLRELMKKGELPSIPIIALTANDRQDDIEKSKSVGIDYHLSKPYDKDTLLNVISRYVDSPTSPPDTALVKGSLNLAV